MLLPGETPATVTAISLAVVFFNAYSGTIAYMRMGRVNYRAGLTFTLAGLPGAVLGALLVREMPRSMFDPIIGALLLVLGILLVVNPLGTNTALDFDSRSAFSNRRLKLGSIGSAYIGVVSSLLGIGGGIIHVPFLIRALGMPAHTATATSHFVLTFVAFTATVAHIVLGQFDRGIAVTMYLAVGVMMGAPLGAVLSQKLHGSLIVRLLALALCLVGLRLVAGVLYSAG
jgi:uncharacterized membrane protein YfcA